MKSHNNFFSKSEFIIEPCNMYSNFERYSEALMRKRNLKSSESLHPGIPFVYSAICKVDPCYWECYKVLGGT